MGDEFDSYMEDEKRETLVSLGKDEGLKPVELEQLVGNYIFTKKTPLRKDVLNLLKAFQPKLKQRAVVGERIIDKIRNYVVTFFNGVE